MYQIENKIEENEGEFFYRENEEVLAKMTYVIDERKNEMIINHTNVDPALKGKGIGALMVEKGIQFAREHKYKIVPLCPFVNTLIKRKPEWQDVI